MHEFVLDKCKLIMDSITTVEQYFQTITKREDFGKEENRIVSDAIIMRLQVIGENVKKLTKKHPDLFTLKLQTDIDPIIRFRDFISHHYERLDHDIVFDICKYHLPMLKQKILQVLGGENN